MRSPRLPAPATLTMLMWRVLLTIMPFIMEEERRRKERADADKRKQEAESQQEQPPKDCDEAKTIRPDDGR